MVFTGCLEAEIGDETYTLDSGDALLLDPTNEQCFHKPGRSGSYRDGRSLPADARRT